MLDGATPGLLHPVLDAVVDELERAPGGLDVFRRLDGRVLIALDGTEYHCSRTIRCAHCSSRLRGKGETAEREYHDAMLGATLVAPGHDKVVPLAPEFMVPQDGTDKQDCENQAAKRWLAAHGARYARLKPVYMGDDLFSRQPLIEAVRAQEASFIFVCKPSSHALIQEYVTGVDLARREEKIRRGKQSVIHRYRWLHGVPLRDGKDALEVNWFEMEIIDARGKTTYRNSWVTDLTVDADTVADMAACGRTRWKIKNETFNVLKNGGYNLEHNFGHGKQHLASILASRDSCRAVRTFEILPTLPSAAPRPRQSRSACLTRVWGRRKHLSFQGLMPQPLGLPFGQAASTVGCASPHPTVFALNNARGLNVVSADASGSVSQINCTVPPLRPSPSGFARGLSGSTVPPLYAICPAVRGRANAHIPDSCFPPAFPTTIGQRRSGGKALVSH